MGSERVAIRSAATLRVLGVDEAEQVDAQQAHRCAVTMRFALPDRLP